MHDVAAAIADIEFARQTHLDWAEHVEAHQASGEPCAQCQARGYPVDPVYERGWVAKYDRVIALLRRLPQAGGLGCMDCGAPYDEFPLDTTLPDEQWRRIHHSEGGILCASCIVKRAGKLPGVIAVRARLEFVPARPRFPENRVIKEGREPN